MITLILNQTCIPLLHTSKNSLCDIHYSAQR